MKIDKNTISQIAGLLIFTAVCSLFGQNRDQSLLPQKDNCLNCHLEAEMMPEDYQEYDVHLQEGLSCSGCHGGRADREDQDDAMAKSAGFIGVPDKKDIPSLCGKCHSDINFMRRYRPRIATDQEEQYYTSIHGKQLKKGDKKVADCSSCHTAHAILPATDPRSRVYPLNVPATCSACHSDSEYMKEYGIPTNQMEEFAAGVHGKALLENLDTGSPACNDCHGNHGAMPPGIESISHVCGSCHVNNMRYFSTTKMARVFAEEDIHGCEECHSNHRINKPSDAMLSGEQAVCSNCHDDDAGSQAAAAIHAELSQAVVIYDSATVLLDEIRRIGMDDVDLGYLLKESHQNIIQARTLVHTFDPQQVAGQTDVAVKKSTEAIDLAHKEIKDNYNRRLGFGFATLFITVLAIALYFKIRQTEQNHTV